MEMGEDEVELGEDGAQAQSVNPPASRPTHRNSVKIDAVKT